MDKKMNPKRTRIFAFTLVGACVIAVVVKVFVIPHVYHPALTLTRVGLDSKQWSEDEYRQAAKIEQRRQKILLPKVMDLIERQDFHGLIALAEPVGMNLRAWNDQQDGPLKEKFSPCHLTQAKLLGMVLDGNTLNQLAYEANRNACDSVIGWW